MFVISIIVIVVLVAADQLIKLLVVNNIPVGKVIYVIHFGDFKVFSLTHITNTGAAWSIMEGRTWFLIGLPLIVCAAALIYMFKSKNKSKLLMTAFSLFIAGGIGNLIDRIRLKEVVDYIKWELFDFPIFNFADICIVIGGILFIIYAFISESKEKGSKKADG